MPYLHYTWNEISFVLVMKNRKHLTLSRRKPLSYRNQSIDLQSKSMDWFLYDNGLLLKELKKGRYKYYQLCLLQLKREQ